MSTDPRAVQDYIEQRFATFDKKRRRRFDSITTREAMEAHVQTCKRKIRRIYGLPRQRCDLNTRVTGEIRCDGYRIEKLIFESRPKLLVSANLYIPDGQGPFPCVLGSCGHSGIGKAAELYQQFCVGLALKGFMVLIYDPIGQGERSQFPNHKEVLRGCVAEHVVLGRQQYLLGEYFGTWRAWDGIRALDLLLDRPEADPTRVGMTGNSGGGTMTTSITALDDRLTMVAPSCFINTYRHNLENELPADTEQVPPGIISAGYELYDHITATAPRPTLIDTKEDDFFDQRGAQEAFSHLHKVYSLLGRADDLEIVTGKGGHGFDKDLREAMYRFFCKHAGISDDGTEPDIVTRPEEELFCEDGGQVMGAGSRSVQDFTLKTHRAALRKREKEAGATGFSVEMLRRLLSLESLPEDPPHHRILRRRNGRSRIAVETEASVRSLITYPPIEGASFRIPPLKHAMLYLPHLDGDEDIDSEPIITEEIAAGRPVLVISTRGVGEYAYDTCGGDDYLALYDSDFFYSSYAVMMGFCMAGRRAYDLLRVVQLLKSAGYESFELAGRGLGALLALYAAPFIPSAKSVRIKNCIPALGDIIESTIHLWPHSALLPGVLRFFDLPDIVDHLKKTKTVAISEPWDANMGRMG